MASLLEVVASLQVLAQETDSFGYRFCYRDDADFQSAFDEKGVDAECDLVQVYVTPDGRFTLQPCDRAGRPSGHPVLPNDGQAFHVGRGAVVTPAKTLYDEIREELAPETEPEPVVEPEPKRGWFRKWKDA